MSDSPAVVLLCSDLMMNSTISGLAAQHGLPFRSVAGVEDLGSCDEGDLVLIDLSTPGLDISAAAASLSESLKQTAVTYGPHVHVDRFEQAEQAGFQNRMARGAFSAQAVQLIGQFAASVP